MKIEIKHRFNLSVLFECEAGSMKAALELAIEKKADLGGADLRSADLGSANLRSADLRSANLGGANLGGADLRSADLRSADLRSANLGGANLRSADLRSANLGGANLGGADLRSADLRSADLRSANLGGADLGGANLGGANLGGADLGGANLGGADLGGIKKDFFERLAIAKDEVVGLYKAHIEGRVDGMIYDGECGCFVGTIANVRGVKSSALKELIGLAQDSSSPTERWYLGISKGMAEGHPVVDITLGWIREWAKENSVALPARKVSWE